MRAISPSSRMISQITPAGSRPGEPRQVDRALGVARADQHAAAPRAQREDVAGRDEVVGAGVARDGDADGLGPLARRDAGRDPVPRVDADRERGVRAASGCRPSSSAGPSWRDALLGQRQADEAAPVARHEVDRLGRDQIGGHASRSPSFSRSSSSTRITMRAGADVLDRARDGRVRSGRISGQSRTSVSVSIGSRGAACALASLRSPPSCGRHRADRRAWRSGRPRG